MTDKEKLVEIVQSSVGGCARNWAEVIADGLIANGVTVQGREIQRLKEENNNLCIAINTLEEINRDLTLRIEGSKQKWVSVEERLPEDEGAVLVCGSRKGIYTAEFRRNGNYHWFHKLNSKCHHCDPTHWMPLPDPPKGE